MKQRIVTGLIAGFLFAGLCIIGGRFYEWLLIMLAFIAYYEFIMMHQVKPFTAEACLGFGTVSVLIIPMAIHYNISLELIIWVSMFIGLGLTVISNNNLSLHIISPLWLGAFYIGIGFKYMMITRTSLGDKGLFWTIMLFAIVWASDIGAYFIGRTVGKHKLWPFISPQKTIEGAIGGIITALVVSILFAAIRPDIITIGYSCIIGILTAVIGQFGDLMQSAYKRACKVKDSGTLLPGHGGILDRCDSWLVVFPFVHLVGLLPL